MAEAGFIMETSPKEAKGGTDGSSINYRQLYLATYGKIDPSPKAKPQGK